MFEDKKKIIDASVKVSFEKWKYIKYTNNENVTNTHKVNKYKMYVLRYANARLKTCKVEDSECSA